MTNRLRLFFTAGGGAGAEAVNSLLGDRYDVHFGDADAEAISPSVGSARRHELPMATDSGFLPQIANLCRDLAIDLLVPGVDEELLPLADNTAELLPTRLLAPSASYIRAVSDKYLMATSLMAGGITVPHTIRFDECNGQDLTFPLILKPRVGRGSRDVRLVKSTAELEAIRLSISQQSAFAVQEYIRGTEYTVQVLASQSSELRAVVPVEVFTKRGVTTHARINNVRAVRDVCEQIHRALPTPGCYNIQGMLTENEQFIPFEINPRVSTTFCMSVAAGIDPVAEFLSDSPRSGTLAEFTDGLELRRHWTNVFTFPGHPSTMWH